MIKPRASAASPHSCTFTHLGVPDLRPAAEALEGKFPEAASLLYRRLVESVLDRGSSKQYPYGERFPILHASLYASADARID
jgi:hypothetical protein